MTRATGQPLMFAWIKGRLPLWLFAHSGVQLAGVTLLAGVLAFLYLGEKSLWVDEGYSVSRAGQEWSKILEFVTPPRGMSLYYVSLHLWMKLAGNSEFALRSLSAVFAIAAVPVAYALVARLFGSRTAITAALLVAVNAFFIRYAQEARWYSMGVFLVTLSSYFFVRSIEQPSWRNWAAYIVSSALIPYTYLLGLLVVGAHAISLVFLRWRGLPWRGLAASALVIGIICLPAVLTLFGDQVGSPEGTNQPWIPKPRLQDIYRIFINLSGMGGGFLLLAYFIPSAVAGLYAVQTWFRYGRSFESWRIAFLLAWLIVPVAFIFTVSIVRPSVVPRYFIVSLPPLAFLVAVGLSQIRYRWIARIMFVVVLVLAVRSVSAWYVRFEKEDWRGAANFVSSNARPGDGILFNRDSGIAPFRYYLERLEGPNSPLEFVNARPGQLLENDQAFLAQLSARYQRLWLVFRYDAISAQNPDEQSTILTFLERYDYIVTLERESKVVTVSLHARSSP